MAVKWDKTKCKQDKNKTINCFNVKLTTKINAHNNNKLRISK